MSNEMLVIYPDVVLGGKSLEFFRNYKITLKELDYFIEGDFHLKNTLLVLANGELTLDQFKYDVMSVNEVF